MASRAIPREEVAGLALAVALHAGLLALLVLKPASAPQVAPPERISVTLSEDVALTSTSPEPQAEAAPPAAPKIAAMAEPEPAPEPEPVPAPAPQPKPQPRIKPEPVAMPVAKPLPAPRPVPRVTPRPLPRVTPMPAPRAVVRPQPVTVPRAAPRVAASPAPRTAPRLASKPAAASRISNDFLKGIPAAQASGAARNPPAAAIGPAVRSALLGAVSRKLKPRWVAPQGAEADRLVTFVTWQLNRDGSLGGTPRVVRQEGITDANRAQAARHAEQAVRAIQLAAPFDLPEEYYDAWKRIVEFRFDRKLSQ